MYMCVCVLFFCDVSFVCLMNPRGLITNKMMMIWIWYGNWWLDHWLLMLCQGPMAQNRADDRWQASRISERASRPRLRVCQRLWCQLNIAQLSQEPAHDQRPGSVETVGVPYTRSPTDHSRGGGSGGNRSCPPQTDDKNVYISHCNTVHTRWFRGSAVERWSLTGELSLSCARPQLTGEKLCG